MRYIIFFLLLVCGQVTAQDYIETKSGEKILVVEGSINVEPGNKRLTYKLPNGVKRKKIKFKDLNSAKFKDYDFRTFDVDGKRKGFFILASQNGKRVATIHSTRVVNKGGFDVPYNRYELAIIDAADKMIEYQVFTDVNNTNNIALRKSATDLIAMHFEDCPNLIERMKTFENGDKNVENGAITGFLTKPYFISCK